MSRLALVLLSGGLSIYARNLYLTWREHRDTVAP
jgi:hypothetical protein